MLVVSLARDMSQNFDGTPLMITHINNSDAVAGKLQVNVFVIILYIFLFVKFVHLFNRWTHLFYVFFCLLSFQCCYKVKCEIRRNYNIV